MVLYFFVFAPMAAIGERVGPWTAAVLSIRAARLPGPRHLAATAAFVALALVVSLFAPTSRVFEASPSITTWLFVLFVTFINMATLATFAYRWLVVRDAAVEAASQAAKEGRRPRPAGCCAGDAGRRASTRPVRLGRRPGLRVWSIRTLGDSSRGPARSAGRARKSRAEEDNREEDHAMPVATRRELLEAGVHFGHQTRRWNPKMRRFIFGERSGIYIIDLEKTSTP